MMGPIGVPEPNREYSDVVRMTVSLLLRCRDEA